jgi:teichuronic acid exporter
LKGLKNKSIGAAKWSILEKVVNIGFEFVIGIVLARLLLPTDFGIVAIISVIISFSLIFVNSGFNQSLVRDTNVSEIDYSTIFIFNIAVGVIAYTILFLSSTLISEFYTNPELGGYIRILGISIVIGSFTFVQRVRLIRNIDFKEISKISIFSSLTSGTIALTMAFSGFGIWSLIAKSIIRESLQGILFWQRGDWKPSFSFSNDILKKHFNYGSNLLYSAIIGQIYNNILALSIGKVFSLQTLGFYNRAQLFSNTIAENIGGVMTDISFPVLAKVQNDSEKFVHGVRLLLKQAFYIIGFLMIGVFFTAKTFIPLILGNQWNDAGIYLQYLAVVGFFGVLNSILLNSISVTGKSRVYLYFQIWALALNIISLLLGYFNGIIFMLTSLVCFYILSYFLISFVFYLYYKYSIFNQIKDFKLILIVLTFMVVIGIIFSTLGRSVFLVILMFFLQTISVFAMSHYLKIDEYLNLRKLFFQRSEY